MKSSTLTQTKQQARHLPAIDIMCRKLLASRLQHIKVGRLEIHDAIGTQTFGEAAGANTVTGRIEVERLSVYREFILGGSVGAAEAYIVGDWDSPHLTDVMRVLVLNIDLLNAMDDGLATLSKPLLKSLHWLNRNTQDGSRRNISAHYDLGNDLFKLFLDPTMMYSAAIFPTPEATLQEASLYKLEHICQKLALKPSDHLVEIGTGWGSMAIYAAQRYGCRVTTTTISREQHDYAAERIRELGLGDKITLLFEDYRNLEGQFDKLVSIEMIEAVGHQYYDTYFATCSRLLKDDGLMLIQAITLPDQRYERAKRNVDFIQRYIFPGSCIPSIAAINEATQRSTDLRLIHLEDIGPHYAETLKQWRLNFTAQLDQVKALGYDEQFCRLWHFYLAYCEGGFAERAIGDAHLLYAKPMNRRAALVGVANDAVD